MWEVHFALFLSSGSFALKKEGRAIISDDGIEICFFPSRKAFLTNSKVDRTQYIINKRTHIESLAMLDKAPVVIALKMMKTAVISVQVSSCNNTHNITITFRTITPNSCDHYLKHYVAD